MRTVGLYVLFIDEDDDDDDSHNKIHYVSINDLFLFGIDAHILGLSRIT